MDFSKIITNNENETLKAGFEFAKTLRPGDIVTLDGDLGCGKTVFTKGICEYFNVTDYVTSPTYTIVNEYQGDEKIFHFDIYRIEEEEELYNIGFYDYLEGGGIVIAEWAINVPEAFYGYKIKAVNIKRGVGENERVIEIKEVEG